MKIYHYDEKNGELIGEGVADPDPLDAGNWLVPAHATAIEPPPPMDGWTINFIAGEWAYVEVPKPEPVPEPVAEAVPVQEQTPQA